MWVTQKQPALSYPLGAAYVVWNKNISHQRGKQGFNGTPTALFLLSCQGPSTFIKRDDRQWEETKGERSPRALSRSTACNSETPMLTLISWTQESGTVPSNPACSGWLVCNGKTL